MYMRVRPVGPKDARIAIVGEAPGREEDSAGIPFVGSAGRLLTQMLRKAGIDRSQCFVTNVVQHRPPNNDFQRKYYLGSRPTRELLEERERLVRELAEVRPNLVIALGNEALRALTADACTSISKWRGSVLEARPEPGVCFKVLPTYHPALVLRQWSFFPIVEFDLRKAAKEAEYPEVRRKERTLLTAPTLSEVEQFCDMCRSSPYLAFDIETIGQKSGRVTIDCIGLAPRDDLAMCIPISMPDGTPCWNADDEAQVWRLVAGVLGDRAVKKIAQNGQYDILILGRHGVRVENFWLDTMNAFHCVYAELPKGLDFLCSVFTDVPYYKDMVRDDRWRYNALDAVVTYEAAFEILREMQEFGVDTFYFTHVHPLLGIYIDVHERGVRIDLQRREQAAAELRAKLEQSTAQLEALVGHPLNVNSPKQMKQWLYEELKLPAQYNRKTGAVTSDEDALKTLAARFDNPAFKLVLDIRETRKLLSTYLEMPLDADGRARTTYLVCGTETGRLASRTSVDGTGGNLQNVPHGICRQVFVPDPGHVFVGADLSQAEARVVAYLAGEESMIRVFEEGGDIHKKNASIIFRKAVDVVTPEERQLAKRLVHASNYGLGPRQFAKLVGIRESDAKVLQNKYFEAFPRIRIWQQAIQQHLKRSRVLENPFGRKRIFFGRWGDDLFREAYAYIPQSTVADVLHRATRNIYARLPQGANIVLQVHDALVVQCPTELVEPVTAIIKEELEAPFVIQTPSGPRTMSIPSEVKVGDNWDVV